MEIFLGLILMISDFACEVYSGTLKTLWQPGGGHVTAVIMAEFFAKKYFLMAVTRQSNGDIVFGNALRSLFSWHGSVAAVT